MAPYQKKLPMSAALRQGGEGVIPPPKGGNPFSLGDIKGPKNIAKPPSSTKIGKGVPIPKLAAGGRMKGVEMPKLAAFRPPKTPRLK
jgi:hypothetical protein